MSKKPDHIHRYKKVNLSGTPGKKYLVYKCLEPTCMHYLPLHLALGKACICSRCNDVMIISKETLTGSNSGAQLFPHCANCIKRKKSPDVDTLSEYLKKVKSVP